MKLVNLQTIFHMNRLIRHKNTGTPDEFARKVQLSRSMLFEYITYMREELEVCIVYDKTACTYYYDGGDLYTFLSKRTHIN